MLKSSSSMSQPETFFRRWSRLKLQSSGANPPPSLLQPAGVADSTGSDESLGVLFQPEVTRDIRQQALRNLFMIDHYRATDGLDVYVDDYSRPELLPAEMLDRIGHARGLIKPDEPAPEPAAGESAAEVDAL